MTPILIALLGALAGLVGGWGVRARLRGGGHRMPGDPPAQPARWIIPVSCVAAGITAYGLADRVWPMPVIGVLAVLVGVALAAIDVEVHRLPRLITWPSYPILVLLLAAGSWASGDWPALRRAVTAGLVTWLVYYLLHVAARRRGLGRGDVTLAGLIGMLLGWFSWPAVLVATYLTFVLAGLWAGALLVSRRAERGTRIAFGRFKIAAALALLAAQ